MTALLADTTTAATVAAATSIACFAPLVASGTLVFASHLSLVDAL